MAGRSVVARFSMAIERLFDEALQLLARVEGHHAPGGNGYFLPGLRVAPGALRLLAELEIAETRELDHLATLKGDPDLRSEEHTPELQSRQYLVCRLLLE